MATQLERRANPEQPFAGLKVYYSGSIKGAPEPDPDFVWQLVQFMAQGGADVLSEHVAARSQEERNRILSVRTGQQLEAMLSHPEPWYAVRKQDETWVDEATHVVAVVNAESLGVGMEITRAILKPERGLPETPILCLVHESRVNDLDWRLRGITEEEAPGFRLETYSDLESAKRAIHEFLTGNPEK